jgi:hypothetical protein
MTKTMRTMLPFQQVISKISEHQRRFEHHFAVMQAALATARVALEEKSLPLHDPEDALVVGPLAWTVTRR